MNKKEKLRGKYLKIRRNINDDFIQNASEKVFLQFIEFNAVKCAKNLFIYMDFDNEIKTDKIIEWSLGKRK